MSKEQEVVDATFDWIVQSEHWLDDVTERLAAVGILIQPWQRLVVARWLDSNWSDSSIPIGERLLRLRLLLEDVSNAAPIEGDVQ